MDQAWLFIFIGLGIPLTIVATIILWRFQKHWKDGPDDVQRETQGVPKPSPSDTPAKVPSKRVGAAFASWIPLLREKNKDLQLWEEKLIMSDLGPRLTQEVLAGLPQKDDPMEHMKSEFRRLLDGSNPTTEPWSAKRPWILFLVGVNGVGKTTTVVKLGKFFKDQKNLKVGVVGADTFRKAAVEQLERGCQRASLDFFSMKPRDDVSEGADPSSVIFDGIKKFQDRDIILIDTSGRLHTKKNLMEELKKMKRVADKAHPGAPHDIWMIFDATLGQNALAQAKVFHEAVTLTGIVLTKMDGLSRGGIIFQLFQELKAPIWFLGVGEGLDDLETYDFHTFVEELFDREAANS